MARYLVPFFPRLCSRFFSCFFPGSPSAPPGSPRLRRNAGFLLLGAVLIVLPWIAGWLGAAWVRALAFAALYAMLALGLNIVVGFAGLLDLGYIAFFAVGAYTYALLASPQLTDQIPAIARAFPHGLHVPLWDAIPLAAVLAAGFGVMLGTPVLKLRGDYLAIVTLGFGEIIRIFLNNLDEPINLTNGPQGISQIDPARLGTIRFDQPLTLAGLTISSVQLYYYLFVAFAALAAFVCHRLHDSRIGRAWMAIREDETAAKAMGIHVRNVKLLAFGLGATFGGAAGALFAAFQGFVSPESFSLMESVVVLAMVVLGGIGHIPGVILGAVLLAMLPEVLRHTVSPLQTALFGRIWIDPDVLRMLLYGLALVVVMRFRPKGLWPAPAHGVVSEVAPGSALAPTMAQTMTQTMTQTAEPETATAHARTGDRDRMAVAARYPAEVPMLCIEGAARRFGGLQALAGADLAIARGAIHGLIGPNGAGKTTFFNVITGLVRPDAGRFELDGRRYDPDAPHRVALAGIARTFQNIRLFPDMTVLENVMVGRHARTRCGALAAVLRTRSLREEERAIRNRARELLHEVGIARYASAPARTLSYGDQRRLEIARALATEPSLLALDEPAAGMNATEKRELQTLLERIRTHGVTILLIEHDVKLVMGLCDRVTVLDEGRVIRVGTPVEVQHDPAVIEAYLGRAPAHAVQEPER